MVAEDDPRASVAAQVRAWDAEGDPRATLALALAGKLAEAKGSGASALSREIRMLLDDLRTRPQVSGAAEPVRASVDPVDEIRQRRERRRKADGR